MSRHRVHVCILCGGKNAHNLLMGHTANFLHTHMRPYIQRTYSWRAVYWFFKFWNWSCYCEVIKDLSSARWSQMQSPSQQRMFVRDVHVHMRRVKMFWFVHICSLSSQLVWLCQSWTYSFWLCTTTSSATTASLDWSPHVWKCYSHHICWSILCEPFANILCVHVQAQHVCTPAPWNLDPIIFLTKGAVHVYTHIYIYM